MTRAKSGQVKSNQAKSGQRFKVQRVCPSGVRAGNCQHTKQHKIHHTFPCTYDPRQSVHNQTTRTKSGQVTPKKSKLYVTVFFLQYFTTYDQSNRRSCLSFFSLCLPCLRSSQCKYNASTINNLQNLGNMTEADS